MQAVPHHVLNRLQFSLFLKKHSLDATVLANYWTILKLPVLLKALEKIVYSQLQVHLDHNGIAEVLIWL